MQSLSAGRRETGVPRVAAVIALALFVAAAPVGCGGDGDSVDPDRTQASVEPADPGSPPDGEPAYEGLGTWWTKLSGDERLASASQFIEDHPDDCAGIDPEDLERQTGIAYGYDFPEAARTSEVMLETCALLRNGA